MFDKFYQKLARVQERRPVLVLFVFLLITIFLGFYMIQLQTDSSFNTLFRDDSETNVQQNIMSSNFGSTDSLWVIAQVDKNGQDTTGVQDIREPDVIEALDNLAISLRALPEVNEVFSLADAFYIGIGELPTSLEQSKAVIAQIPETQSLLSDDYQAALLIVDINVESKTGSLGKIENDIKEKIDRASAPTGVVFTLTGEPTLLNRIMNLLISDNMTTILLALTCVFFLLWAYFRSPSIAFVSIIPVALTLIWLGGTMHLLGIKITFFVASIGAMMVGMGIDYSIHMTHSYHHNVRKAVKDPTKATVVSVGGALTASALTTFAGFFAMTTGVSPGSIVQGTVLSIGIIYAFIASIVVLPAVLVLQRRFLYRRLDEILFKLTVHGETKTSFLQTFLKKLAIFQARRPYVILVALLIFTVLVIPGFGLVRLDTSNENWIPEDDPVYVALEDVAANFGGLDSQNFLVYLNNDIVFDDENHRQIRDLRDPRLMQQMYALSQSVQQLEFISGSNNPAVLIAEYNDGKVPDDFERIKTIVAENPEIQDYFNDDYSLMRFSFIVEGMDDNEQYFELLEEIETIGFPEDVLVKGQGGFAEDIELDRTLSQDTMQTTLLGFLFVIIIASLFYRSFVVGLLAMIPIIFSAIWTVGLMGYIDLPFTVLTTGMLAILMGIGIDFSIHIIHRSNELIKEGNNVEDALVGSLTSTGEAIVVSTMTTVVGFLALVFASLLATQRLGYTLALGIGATFLSCMLIVPSILAIKWRNKK